MADMKKSLKKLLHKNGDTGPPSSLATIPSTAFVTSSDGAFSLETSRTRLLFTKTPEPRHMPFSILTTLLSNFTNQIHTESRVYSADYPVYRDPSYTHESLTMWIERCKGVGTGGGGAGEQLTYKDLMLLCAVAREHLGRIDDETCEIEVLKRAGGKDSGWECVARGALGFTKAAMLMMERDGVASNTTDVRW